MGLVRTPRTFFTSQHSVNPNYLHIYVWYFWSAIWVRWTLCATLGHAIKAITTLWFISALKIWTKMLAAINFKIYFYSMSHTLTLMHSHSCTHAHTLWVSHTLTYILSVSLSLPLSLFFWKDLRVSSAMSAWESNVSDFKKFNALLYQFIWNRHFGAAKAPDKIKREIINTTIEFGCFGLLDIQDLDRSLKLKMLVLHMVQKLLAPKATLSHNQHS